MFKVAGKQLADFSHKDPVTVRKQVLAELKLGIGDIGKRVLRQKENSKDEFLFPVEYTDIFFLLDQHPLIRKIIITSKSGANSVLSWFHNYCKLNEHSFAILKGKLTSVTTLTFKDRKIEIYIISSPSRLSPIKGD